MPSESILQSWRDTPTRRGIVEFVGAVTEKKRELEKPMGFANDDLCNATGQKIPFPATASARMSSNDPRLSIAERYPTHANYVLKVTLDATKLAFQRFLLPEDVARYVIRAVVARVP